MALDPLDKSGAKVLPTVETPPGPHSTPENGVNVDRDGTPMHDAPAGVPDTKSVTLPAQGGHLIALPATVTGGDETVLTIANLIRNRADPGRTATFILPYGAARVNLNRPPVLFVHGMFGNLDRFAAMVEWAHQQGRQVFVAKYDTGDTLPDDSARALTERLQALEALYSAHGRPMEWDLITHSMGGPVMQLVLEQMWTQRDATVRWTALDPPAAGRRGTFFDGLSGLFGGTGDVIDALEPNAPLFTEQLYRHEVPAGRLTYFVVASRDKVVPSLWNMSTPQVRSFMDAIQSGVEPTDPIVRNLLRNLQQDSRFPALAEWLTQRNDPTPFSFLRHAEELGFVANGNHNTVMRNANLLKNVFNRWLSPPPREIPLEPVLEATELL